MTETQAQREEQISHRLATLKTQIQHDLARTSDINLKRLQVDAATIVMLSLTCELLPDHIQPYVKEMIDLHESMWNMDITPKDNSTPRKPLGQRLIQRLTLLLRSANKELVQS